MNDELKRRITGTKDERGMTAIVFVGLIVLAILVAGILLFRGGSRPTDRYSDESGDDLEEYYGGSTDSTEEDMINARRAAGDSSYHGYYGY